MAGPTKRRRERDCTYGRMVLAAHADVGIARAAAAVCFSEGRRAIIADESHEVSEQRKGRAGSSHGGDVVHG